MHILFNSYSIPFKHCYKCSYIKEEETIRHRKCQSLSKVSYPEYEVDEISFLSAGSACSPEICMAHCLPPSGFCTNLSVLRGFPWPLYWKWKTIICRHSHQHSLIPGCCLFLLHFSIWYATQFIYLYCLLPVSSTKCKSHKKKNCCLFFLSAIFSVFRWESGTYESQKITVEFTENSWI